MTYTRMLFTALVHRSCIRNAAKAVLLTFGFLAALPASADSDAEFPGADRAGPLLTTNQENPSVAAYNRAIKLYERKKFAEALEEMRVAVRTNKFGYTNMGLAYSNLCLMYLKVGKYKNAQASCSKALIVLPAYIPATINLARAKERTAPTAE